MLLGLLLLNGPWLLWPRSLVDRSQPSWPLLCCSPRSLLWGPLSACRSPASGAFCGDSSGPVFFTPATFMLFAGEPIPVGCTGWHGSWSGCLCPSLIFWKLTLCRTPSKSLSSTASVFQPWVPPYQCGLRQKAPRILSVSCGPWCIQCVRGWLILENHHLKNLQPPWFAWQLQEELFIACWPPKEVRLSVDLAFPITSETLVALQDDFNSSFSSFLSWNTATAWHPHCEVVGGFSRIHLLPFAADIPRSLDAAHAWRTDLLITITSWASCRAPLAAAFSADSAHGRCFEPSSTSTKQPFCGVHSHSFCGWEQRAGNHGWGTSHYSNWTFTTRGWHWYEQWFSTSPDLPSKVGGHFAFCHDQWE